MSEDSKVTMLRSVVEVLQRLTWGNVFLGVAVGLLATGVAHVWETRGTLLPAIFQSPTVATGVVATGVCIILVAIFCRLVGKVEEKGDAIAAHLNREIEQTRVAWAESRSDRASLRAQVVSLEAREGNCQVRLTAAEEQIERLIARIAS